MEEDMHDLVEGQEGRLRGGMTRPETCALNRTR